MPTIGRLIAGDVFGDLEKVRARSAVKKKTIKQSTAIENDARGILMRFRGGIKRAEEMLRIEKKYKYAQPIHRRILRQAQSTTGKLALMKQYGLYNPKRKPSMYQVNKAWADNKDYLEPGYLFVARPKSEKSFKEVVKRAKHSQIKTTPKGLFVKVATGTRDAKLVRFKETKYAVQTKHDYHTAQGRARTETVLLPLATADEVLAKRHDVIKSAKKKARKLGKDHYLRYYVEGKYGSHSEFDEDEIDEMWAEFEFEHSGKGTARTDAELYGFVNRIKIGITTPNKRRNKVLTRNELEYRKKVRKKTAMKKRTPRKSKYEKAKGR